MPGDAGPGNPGAGHRRPHRCGLASEAGLGEGSGQALALVGALIHALHVEAAGLQAPANGPGGGKGGDGGSRGGQAGHLLEQVLPPQRRVPVRREAVQEPSVNGLALAISQVRQAIPGLAPVQREHDAALGKQAPVPACQQGRIGCLEVGVDRPARPAFTDQLSERVRSNGARIEADEMQAAASLEGCGGGHREIEAGAEPQLANAQGQPALCRVSRLALDLSGCHEHPLDLARAIGRMVDVVEVPGEGLAVLPNEISRIDHGATGRSGSLIHSLHEPG